MWASGGLGAYLALTFFTLHYGHDAGSASWVGWSSLAHEFTELPGPEFAAQILGLPELSE